MTERTRLLACVVWPSAGGDCTFSNCVNEQGITYSDLGWSIAHRRRFPGRVKNQFGLLDRGELAAYLKAGEAGTCDDQCKVRRRGVLWCVCVRHHLARLIRRW